MDRLQKFKALIHVRAKNSYRCGTRPFEEFAMQFFFRVMKQMMRAYYMGEQDVRLRKKT